VVGRTRGQVFLPNIRTQGQTWLSLVRTENGNTKDTFSSNETLHRSYTIQEEDMTPAANNSDKFLSVQEAAHFLRDSPRTVYGWVSQRVLPARYAGRRLLFLESELIEWTKHSLRSTERSFAR
jgi:excisionase family DNA binding protein